MKMSNITFDVARSKSCVFKKCSEKKYIHDYIRDQGLKVYVGIMLAQRHKRWPRIISALGQYIVFSG